MRLSDELDTAAAGFDAEARQAIAEGHPEAAATSRRLAAHLRRLAATHRAAAAYQDDPAADPPQGIRPGHEAP